MMILRGVTLFPYYDLGGLWNENGIEHRRGQPFFTGKRKENENMLLDALIIPVFYFISTKCWYRTRERNLMHDTHFLCYKVSLLVAQTHSCHSPHSRSPHSHSNHNRSQLLTWTLLHLTPHSHALQEMKDDLLDDTAWPFPIWFTKY